MLDQNEKKHLGHLKNWTYAEAAHGIKVFGFSEASLLNLAATPEKRDRLKDFIAFEADSPCFIEISGLPSAAGIENGLLPLLDDLKKAPGSRLDGSHVVLLLKKDDVISDGDLPFGTVDLGFYCFLEPDAVITLSDPQIDRLAFLRSRKEDLLTAVRVGPSQISGLAQLVANLAQSGFVHFSIQVDYQQDWNESDFPVIEDQWRQILATVRKEKENKPGYVAECRRAMLDAETFCMPGNHRVFVDEEGILWPCASFYKDRFDQYGYSAIGTLHQGILDHENLPFAQFDPDKMQGCGVCEWNMTCNNGCLWLNHNKNNSFYKTLGPVCAYEKAVRSALDSEPLNCIGDLRFDAYLPFLCPAICPVIKTS